MPEAVFLKELLIVLAVTLSILFFFQRVGLPSIVGFLLAGVVIGPHGLELVREVPAVATIANIGVIILLFTIGLEMSLAELAAVRGYAAWAGLLQVFLTVAAVAVLGSAFARPPRDRFAARPHRDRHARYAGLGARADGAVDPGAGFVGVDLRRGPSRHARQGATRRRRDRRRGAVRDPAPAASSGAAQKPGDIHLIHSLRLFRDRLAGIGIRHLACARRLHRRTAAVRIGIQPSDGRGPFAAARLLQRRFLYLDRYAARRRVCARRSREADGDARAACRRQGRHRRRDFLGAVRIT